MHVPVLISMGALGCPALAAGAAQSTALAAGDQRVEEGVWRVVIQQGQHSPILARVSKDCCMADWGGGVMIQVTLARVQDP
jgi:hypothetical protein